MHYVSTVALLRISLPLIANDSSLDVLKLTKLFPDIHNFTPRKFGNRSEIDRVPYSLKFKLFFYLFYSCSGSKNARWKLLLFPKQMDALSLTVPLNKPSYNISMA